MRRFLGSGQFFADKNRIVTLPVRRLIHYITGAITFVEDVAKEADQAAMHLSKNFRMRPLKGDNTMWIRVNWTGSIAAILFTAIFLSTALQAETATEKAPTMVSVFGEASLSVPAQFERVEVQSRILEHEFQAKAGEDKTARVTMMAAGGDVADNIKRWKGQFAGGDVDAQKAEEHKFGNWQVHIVDCSGSYQERMGGGPFAGGKVVTREDYAMTGAILVHPEGRKYFVKMIGPDEVVKANRKAFVDMIKAIK